MPAARVAALSGFLRAHSAGAVDEVAVSAPSKAGPLIARDGRPVLILSDGQGNQLVSPAALAHAVAAGRVRYALLGDACTASSGNERTGCLPVVRWARAHGVDVSRAAGQPHAGALYAVRRRAAAAEAAEELRRSPRRCEGCRRRLGPRATGPAVGLAVEAHVLDALVVAVAAHRRLPGEGGSAATGARSDRDRLAAVHRRDAREHVRLDGQAHGWPGGPRTQPPPAPFAATWRTWQFFRSLPPRPPGA